VCDVECVVLSVLLFPSKSRKPDEEVFVMAKSEALGKTSFLPTLTVHLQKLSERRLLEQTTFTQCPLFSADPRTSR